MQTFKTILQDFAHLLFPDNCLGCQEVLSTQEQLICTNCLLELPITNYHLDPKNPLAQRFWGKVRLENAFAYCKFTKSGTVQSMLHALKYKGAFDLGVMLGNWYGTQLKESDITQFDYITPVPLHPKKLLQRGYNQSDAFAKGLSESMNIAWLPDLLLRNKHTATQTKKSRFERWLNVSDIFVVNAKYNIQNLRILVVDDVITTGSTIEACVQALHQSQVKSVSVAAIATP